MKQLSGLDASFLYLETAEMPMHVGALHLLERPRGLRGRFVNALRRHVASRLPAAPVLRRRLAWMPLNLANPAWVDAEPDLQHHITEVALPAGSAGDMAALEALVAGLHTQLLDRGRPLWRFHVIEGLAAGPDGRRRVALYTQLHHAAVDGQAAVALAAVLFDSSPEPRTLPALRPARPPRHALGRAEMISGAVVNQVQQLGQMARALPGMVGALSQVAVQQVARSRLAGADAANEGGWARAPRTRLNATVEAGRAFATASLPLPELKALARAHGASVNDAVLWLCSTALRQLFARHGPLPRQSLVAAVPVSLRAHGDVTADNQATITLVSLGTQIADPLRRLAHLKAVSASMKAWVAGLREVLPTDFPSIGMPWLIEAAAALIGRTRAAERVPALANLAISNVPGPTQPLYLVGARLLANHPASIVVHGVALNITVQSYAEVMDFGFMACAKALPPAQLRLLADGVRVAFDELRALAADANAAPAPLSAGAVARKVLRHAMDQAWRGARDAVPAPLGDAARLAGQAWVGDLVKAGAAAVPDLAQQAVRRAVQQAVRRALPKDKAGQRKTSPRKARSRRRTPVRPG